MIWQVINNSGLSWKDRVKNTIYYISRVKGAQKSWSKRHSMVLYLNYKLNKKCDPEIEDEHLNLWSAFRSKADPTTLRISKNLSGVADPRMVPEDIFVADIEPTLITDKSVDYIAIKSFYNRWFSEGIFPEDLFHRIDGQYYTVNLEKSNYDTLQELSNKLVYPVILKPNKNTYGGEDVNIVESSKELLKLAGDRENFILQKRINQHDFFKNLYPQSLNTIKVNLYRSVTDDKLHILSMSLRIGKDGYLDNESLGGINTMVRSDGYLNGYAIDKLGRKYEEHPKTGMRFNCKVPEIEKLKSLSLRVGKKVFYTRIFSLDACYDKTGKWRIIELNTNGQSIRFSQYGGQPFFGRFTNEVIEYCKENHWALK